MDSKQGRKFLKFEKDDLLEQHIRLLKTVFNSDLVEINIHKQALQAPSLTAESHLLKPLINASNQLIGEIIIKDIRADGLEAHGKEILEIIAANIVKQFQFLEEYAALIQQVDISAKEIASHRNELDTLYEDLNLAHEELSQAFTATFQLGKSLSKSKTKISGFLEKAPIAFGVLRHRQLKIEMANNLILELWGKDKTVLGKPLAAGLPELQDQPYLEILDRVYTTGERYIGKEAKAILEKDGQKVDCYFNFIYEPLKNDRGTTNSIMIIATDVSDLVKSRNELLPG
ncbi:PAS domain-containing protein [Pedobacter agri]|uniref:PAS domain-containing protein n=1 Tax=Pedobacter agri TaxID=454586 RepID=UPI00293047F5|nr:PAS domain-containing protein [Pedobacter agri]